MAGHSGPGSQAAEAQGSGASVSGLPDDAAGRLMREILGACPTPHLPLLELFQEISAAFLPAALGRQPIDPRRPGGLFATFLAGPDDVSWASAVFGDRPEGAGLLAIAADGLDAAAVEFEAGTGTIRARVASWPADGAWRLFGLVRGNVYRSDPTRREVFALARPSAGPPPGAGPAELVRRGFLAEGWAAAIRAGWDERALVGLLLLLVPAQRRLIAQATTSMAPARTDYAFLRRDLERAPNDHLAPMQQALIERFEHPTR